MQRPRTIVGFDQYAQGWLDIVQTNEARKLLLKTYRQDEYINALRRDYHEAVNDSESTKIALEAALSRSVDALKFAGAERLRAEAAENDAAAAQANARAATVRAAWLAVLASLCLMAAIILGVVRRRAARVYVPDSPAELVELSER